MLLLALQTTTSAAGDRSIDTLTLILVVIFIAAMLALSISMHRSESDPPDEPVIERKLAADPDRPQLPATAAPPVYRERATNQMRESVPVWLQGVTIPSADASLSDVIRLIEALLTARRNHDLAAGLNLYAPGSRDALAARFRLDSSDAEHATFEGDPPSLRGAEILEATGNRMRVRVAYSNGANEIYTLIHLDNAWLIEDIDSSR